MKIMALDCFNPQDCANIVERINSLQPNTQRLWGKMTVAQMLKHCSIPYHQIFDPHFPKAPLMMRLLLKWFYKQSMVNTTPYKQNLRTAPVFVVKDEPDFELHKTALIDNVLKVCQLGSEAFEMKPQITLGPLTAKEWSNMLYKHLDHHLRQFGA